MINSVKRVKCQNSNAERDWFLFWTEKAITLSFSVLSLLYCSLLGSCLDSIPCNQQSESCWALKRKAWYDKERGWRASSSPQNSRILKIKVFCEWFASLKQCLLDLSLGNNHQQSPFIIRNMIGIVLIINTVNPCLTTFHVGKHLAYL